MLPASFCIISGEHTPTHLKITIHPMSVPAFPEAEENAAASMGVMANASYRRGRRKSRSHSVGLAGDGVADGMRVSNASRQYSRQHSDGERAAKTTSAVAQEAFNAGGALQTVEGKEEGAVALRVRHGAPPGGV